MCFHLDAIGGIHKQTISKNNKSEHGRIDNLFRPGKYELNRSVEQHIIQTTRINFGVALYMLVKH